MKHIHSIILLVSVVALAPPADVHATGAASAPAQAPPATITRSCLPVGEAAPAQLADLAAAVGMLGQATLLDGYFARLLSECELNICLDPSTIDCRGYFEPQEHLIAVGVALSRLEMTLILAHELRHFDQHRRGYGPSLTVAMSENIRVSFAMEADAQAITTLFAWSAREAGDPALWQALEALEHSQDIAAAFEEAVAAGATPAGATRAAFTAWYGSSWRRERYRAAAVTHHLDHLDEAKAIPSSAELPPSHFDGLCRMPDGSNYGCHLTREIGVKK
ncbi:MAG TPA: DUF6782 family putative metallopeptidase [Saliniramus sp.]|nr:DUF6782 family putative metallopeptidase [Saliniramus sp.]